jgi:predicted nuclease with TOPRIM domain
MFGNEIEEAIQELEEFQKSLAQIQSKNGQGTIAIEKARAQAARIAEQLRQLQGGYSAPPDEGNAT